MIQLRSAPNTGWGRLDHRRRPTTQMPPKTAHIASGGRRLHIDAPGFHSKDHTGMPSTSADSCWCRRAWPLDVSRMIDTLSFLTDQPNGIALLPLPAHPSSPRSIIQSMSTTTRRSRIPSASRAR